MITNEEKRKNYAELKVRLRKAMSYGFWFEACMIEYSIIEDRTSSILAHSKICKNPYDKSKKLANKLNSILYQINKDNPMFLLRVSSQLIDEIKNWKDRRNEIVHNACIRHYDEKELEEIVVEGKRLADEISNAAKRISNYCKRIDEKTKV